MKNESVLLKAILILGLLALSGCKRARTEGGMIFGEVTEYGTRKPMTGAEVIAYSAEGVRLSTTSDASGNYSIANVPPGSYKVRAYLQGYYLNETMEEVQIEKGKKKVDFQLVVVGGGT